MTREEAFARVGELVAASSIPVLTDAEVFALVDANRRYRVWRASTAYNVGDRVIPAVGTGRVFVCHQAGTSASLQTLWSDTAYRRRYPFVDGSCYWLDAGLAHPELYDVRGAAGDGWRLKAAKVAGKFDYSSDGQSFSRSQMYEHCMAQSRLYGRIGVI